MGYTGMVEQLHTPADGGQTSYAAQVGLIDGDEISWPNINAVVGSQVATQKLQ